MAEGDAAAPLELRFPARPEELRHMREALRERLRAWRLDEACATDVVMAVDEACQNVIRHAYAGDPAGVIELAVARAGDELRIAVRDFAPPVDPARIRPRPLDELRPGGLGTHLIRSAMDHTELGRPPSGPGNLLRMVKKLARGAEDGSCGTR
jgi:sigma-B regulation protein RsbU (phosphoserine phosphatase)